jgi:hypothetical protein
MKVLIIILLSLFIEKCFSQQPVTLMINDSIKKNHISAKIWKKKKIKIKTTVINNTKSIQILLFFDKKILSTSSNVFFDTLNFEKKNIISNCSGLRALFYDSLNNILKPKLIKSTLKRLNCFQRLNENIRCSKLLNDFKFTKKLILYPYEKKEMSINIFLRNKYKYPLIYTNKEIIEGLYEYPLNKGNYYLELNYFILNKNSYLPDYIEYIFLYSRLSNDMKINDCFDCRIEDKIFIGHIKSNKIKLNVK